MKRDEREEARPPQREPGFGSFNDSAVGLADMRITRARAIKLAGAALAGSALSVVWAGEAEARNKKKKRRRRRRKRQITSTPNPLNFGDTSTTLPTPAQGVTSSNLGPHSVTLEPTVFGDGFALVDGASFTLDPGETKLVEVVFAPDVTGPSTGELRLVDTRDGLVVENVDLLGNGVL